MFSRKLSVACFMFICLLINAGCASATPPAAWSLFWASSPRAAQSYTPEAAYAACARAQIPGGAAVSPAASTWLATGSHPRIGLALARLDPASQFISISVITVDPGSSRWTLTESGTLARPAVGGGVPVAQGAGHAWTLPAGTYNSLALEVPDTQPGGSAQLWVSDSNQEFVLARLYSTIQPPPAHTTVTLAGQPGWETTQGRFTIIGLILTSGIYAGLGTLIFAGTTGVQESEHLATQAATNLMDILPS